MKREIKDFLICQLCKKEFLTARDRNLHILNTHLISFNDYIINVYFDGMHPTCKCGCNTPVTVKFYKNVLQWSDYTKNHFPRKPHSEKTKALIKKNTKKAIRKKYGVDNVFLLKEVQKTIKETNLKKYGVDNPMKNDEIKKLAWHLQSDNTINKIKNTNQKKYGANAYTSTKKGKDTIKKNNLKKYGVTNPAKLNSVKVKTANSNLKKYGFKTNLQIPAFRKKYNGKTSKIETYVCEELNAQHKFFYKNKEFDIIIDNNIIEVDGDFFHPSNISNLTFTQISSIINDYQKNEIIKKSKYNLIRIHVSDLPDDINIDGIKKNAYIPNYDIKFNDVIISKEYLKKYKEKQGLAKLERYIPLLLKFIRTIQSEFPIITNNENISDIMHHINHSNLDKLNINDSDFNNKYYNTGISFLKSIFKSYWSASYKNSLSPIDAWNNDGIMTRIIKYRIGAANNNPFDFSLKQLLTGITVNRYSVSFFKPMLAAAIYKKYLKNTQSPVVFDPCAGFGGRLLGYKSIYPNGTYIGVEPNIEAFNELNKLLTLGNFTNVKLYNCKIEDFNEKITYDFGFTSIPYFDLENYNNKFEYDTFDIWKETFISKLLDYDNLYINMNNNILDRLDDKFIEVGKIYSNRSPFNKGKSDNYEVIVKKI